MLSIWEAQVHISIYYRPEVDFDYFSVRRFLQRCSGRFMLVSLMFHLRMLGQVIIDQFVASSECRWLFNLLPPYQLIDISSEMVATKWRCHDASSWT